MGKVYVFLNLGNWFQQNRPQAMKDHPESLKRTASAKTPKIEMSSFTGEILISGRSIPENAASVFEPVLKWIEGYKKDPKKVTNLRLNLEYFNTSSALWISKIVKSLSLISHRDYVLFIHLYFHIEEFDEMESEEIENALAPISDIISMATVSIGIKVYGTDSAGAIVKEKIILV